MLFLGGYAEGGGGGERSVEADVLIAASEGHPGGPQGLGGGSPRVAAVGCLVGSALCHSRH